MMRAPSTSWLLGLGMCLAALVVPRDVIAQDMPDPSVIHGRALPAPELPNGTVTVRVVREAIGNDAPGQQVRVTVGGTSRTATTDQQGRAEFTGLPQGEARAEVTVDGEALQSQPFAVPTSGGLRVILVAGIAKAAERKKNEEAAALAAPVQKGAVVLGGDSRIIMEFDQDNLFAFYILDIVNTARTRVDIGGPLKIVLPEQAAGAQIREGSAKSAEVDGRNLTIHGPFAPGTTQVQVEFTVRFDNQTETIVQPFPVPLQQAFVGIEKIGRVGMASPQFSNVSERQTESGVFLLGLGGAVTPGTPLTFTLSNLPVHSATARYVTLAVALLIAGFGVWMAVNPGMSSAVDRKALNSRREKLLAELAPLEARRRDGALPDKSERRRQRILAELEQIYAELDATAGPQGGGEGIAA